MKTRLRSLRGSVGMLAFLGLATAAHAQQIATVAVDRTGGLITVTGSALATTAQVTFGTASLAVHSVSSTQVVAGFSPAFYPPTFYRLQLKAKNGQVVAEFDVDMTVGPAGAQGPQGPIGLTGATGPVGPVGPAGPAGAIGPTGPVGPSGPAGEAGAIGPAGPAGPTGATGAIGPAGPAGEAGPIGSAGPAGPAGAVGATGPQGPEGPAGPTGPQGPAGSTGPSGVSGWQRVSVNWNLPAGQVVGMYAECPAGKRPLGGGWFGAGSDEVVIGRMEPDDIAYNVIARSLVSYAINIRVTVICATAN